MLLRRLRLRLMAEPKKVLREIARSFVADPSSGVCIRDRLKGLMPEDDKVLRLVGAHMGSLASLDLAARCADGLAHSTDTWAARKRELTAQSSSRWAGSVTGATHAQWGLSRRAQFAHLQGLEAGIRTIGHRLSLPIGEKGGKRAPGGYRSKNEWFQKTRRLHVLEDRLDTVRADREAGRVHVVRGGRKLASTRHNLSAANLTETDWRERWEAARWFLSADGESGKRFGNETIRVTPDGEVSIKLPAPLAELANTEHGRYTLAAKVRFPHRRQEWADRIETNRAVAYRIHLDVARGRWYLDASWTRKDLPIVPAGQPAGRWRRRRRHERRSPCRLAPRPARQPRRRAPPFRLRPVRHRELPGRPTPPRPHPTPALGQQHRSPRHRR